MRNHGLELGILLGATIGLMVASRNTTINTIGITTIVIIAFLCRHNLKEAFWSTESDKLMALILVAVVGMAFIIMYRTPASPALILTATWAILVILLLGKLWGIVTNKIFELETKEAEIRHLNAQNRQTTWLLKQAISGNKWAIEFIKRNNRTEHESYKEV